MNLQQEPTHVFRSVWLLREPRRGRTFFSKFLAFDDTGSLMVFSDRLEFHGQNATVLIEKISSVRAGRYGFDKINEWLRVEHSDGPPVYLKEGSALGWGGLLGGNGQLLEAIKHTIRTPRGISEAEAAPVIEFYDTNRIPVAKEEVEIPPGVKVKVRRNKTVSRSIELENRSSSGGSSGVTIKGLIEASVQHRFEQVTGSSFHESETVDYEVELDGNKATRYYLEWIEVWREGLAKLDMSETRFRIRERVELEVSIAESSRAKHPDQP